MWERGRAEGSGCPGTASSAAVHPRPVPSRPVPRLPGESHLGCHAGSPPLEGLGRRGQEAQTGHGTEQRPAGHGAGRALRRLRWEGRLLPRRGGRVWERPHGPGSGDPNRGKGRQSPEAVIRGGELSPVPERPSSIPAGAVTRQGAELRSRRCPGAGLPGLARHPGWVWGGCECGGLSWWAAGSRVPSPGQPRLRGAAVPERGTTAQPLASASPCAQAGPTCG